jgi:hypothetical protein
MMPTEYLSCLDISGYHRTGSVLQFFIGKSLSFRTESTRELFLLIKHTETCAEL